jgi:hypothetical protein
VRHFWLLASLLLICLGVYRFYEHKKDIKHLRLKLVEMKYLNFLLKKNVNDTKKLLHLFQLSDIEKERLIRKNLKLLRPNEVFVLLED